MNVLIDTHIFLWLLLSHQKVSQSKYAILRSPKNTIFLSSISVVEIMIKHRTGKLTIDFDPIYLAQKMDISLLDFTAQDALDLKTLPLHHKDPFDRMLICQAINRGFSLLTDDEIFKQYPCKLL